LSGVNLTAAYHDVAEKHAQFLSRLWDCHTSNETDLNFVTSQSVPSLAMARHGNPNPRCFLAIEIENAVTKKHLLGGIVNAVALGYLAVLIGWTDKKVRNLFRARSYLHFLEQADKPTLLARNIMIIGRDQAETLFGTRGSPPNEEL
jgi:hypothetical protein